MPERTRTGVRLTRVHRREPVRERGILAARDGAEALREPRAHGAGRAAADLLAVDALHRPHARGGAGQEHLVGGRERLGPDLALLACLIPSARASSRIELRVTPCSTFSSGGVASTPLASTRKTFVVGPSAT